MSDNSSTNQLAQLEHIASYIAGGEHLFVACDNEELRLQCVLRLIDSLCSKSLVQVDAGSQGSIREFSEAIQSGCDELKATLGFWAKLRMAVSPRDSQRQFPSLSISTILTETMREFELENRQGFLVIHNVDPVIEMQNTFEVEGAMRSVMQLRSEVAIVICGSNRVINKLVGDYDRPFYMSFRVFRI